MRVTWPPSGNMVISWISIRLSVIERSQNVENNAFQIRLIKKVNIYNFATHCYR